MRGAEPDRLARNQTITWLVDKHGSHGMGGSWVVQQQDEQVLSQGLRTGLLTDQHQELSQGLFSQGHHIRHVPQELPTRFLYVVPPQALQE